MNPTVQNFSCSGDSSLQHECNLKQILGSTDHPVPGHLNIAPPCVCVGVGPCGILPRRRNSRPRSFSRALNRSPVLRDKLAETCAAPLRRVLRLGHASTTQLTGQHRMENVSPLNGGILSERNGVVWTCAAHRDARHQKPSLRHWLCHHSEDCSFPFVSHFMSRSSLMLTALVLSSGGTCFCFLLFLFLLIHSFATA